jgi:hypothetical protein
MGALRFSAWAGLEPKAIRPLDDFAILSHMPNCEIACRTVGGEAVTGPDARQDGGSRFASIRPTELSPHPEERRGTRCVSKDRGHSRAFMVRDGAPQQVLCEDGASTRLLTMSPQRRKRRCTWTMNTRYLGSVLMESI